MQLLHYLQQHHNNLSPQQQDLWHQLSQQYQLMRQQQRDQLTQQTRPKLLRKNDAIYIKEEITSTTDSFNGNDELVIVTKTSLDQTLLKQFGNNGIQIKQEDGKQCRIASSKIDLHTSKHVATSTSARQSIPKFEVQNEPIYTRRQHAFSTDMTSDEIIELAK